MTSHGPRKVWVTDKRYPKKKPFLYEEHLLKFSQNLEQVKTEATQVTEPARRTKQEEGKK